MNRCTGPWAHAILALSLITVLGASGCAGDEGRRLAAARGLPHPALIAHRGASHLAPEQTRAAYLLARDLGADLLELDLQRTRDGILVAVHDDSLDRTTDVGARFPPRAGAGPGERARFAVGRFTWAEIQQLDAGTWFNRAHPRRARESYRGSRIPSLDQVLDIAEAGSRHPGVFIETKSPMRYPGIERQLVAALTRRGWIGPRRRHGPVLFQSFVPQSLESLRVLAPEVPRFLLAEEGAPAREMLATAARLGAGYAPHARDLLRHPGLAAAAHRRGMLVYPWVLDAPWQMTLARRLGCDGVFTNRIEVAVVAAGRVGSLDLDRRLRRLDEALLTGRVPRAPEDQDAHPGE